MAKAKGAPRKKTVGKLPSRQEILDFLATSTSESGKREIARAFGVKGGDRIALKELLRDMADDGLIEGQIEECTFQGASYGLLLRHASGVGISLKTPANAPQIPTEGETARITIEPEYVLPLH